MKQAKRKARNVPIQNQWRSLRFAPDEVRRAIRALDDCGLFTCPRGELSLVFMDDDAIARVHAEFFDDPSPTDVITFEGDPAMDFAGEICVSVEHALRYASAHGTGFPHELTLYLVHGYLHLSGYDDIDPSDRRRMRAAEKKALLALEKSGNLPEFRVVT